MSKKTHFKVFRADKRSQGQTDEEYRNQSLCGYDGVCVTKIPEDVSCKLCLKDIKEFTIDGRYGKR